MWPKWTLGPSIGGRPGRVRPRTCFDAAARHGDRAIERSSGPVRAVAARAFSSAPSIVPRRPGMPCRGRSDLAAMPASQRDMEMARARLGSTGGIAKYVVRLGASVENTARSEINAMCKGRPTAGGRLRAVCRALLWNR